MAHGGDEGHIPINRQRILESGFDYIALGHIHKPHFLAKNRAAYAGALEPLEINDSGEHGYIAGAYERGEIKTQFVPFACRQYIRLDLESDRSSTDFFMREQLERSIKKYGEHNIYKVRIGGFRDPDICYPIGQYLSFGNILDITDETEPDYDFEALCRAHGSDVVGRYIAKLLDEEKRMPATEQTGNPVSQQNNRNIRKKALYYGVRAMMSGRWE